MKVGDLLRQFQGKYIKSDRDSSDFIGGEFEIYYGLAKLIAPENVLEIGVYCGYSAASIIAGAKNTLRSYTGIDAELYRSDSNSEAHGIIDQMQRYQQTTIGVALLRLNTQIECLTYLKGRTFDWVHIDAGHSKREAMHDIIQFWPITGRVMSIHDVSSHVPVREAVKEVLRKNLVEGCSASLEVKSLHGFQLLFK
jgi:predicted O-methyltransferase YrrM